MTSIHNQNRVSIRIHCPNPLFESWLEEWRDQAKKKDSKTQHAYSLALQSLRKYPLPLEKARDCKILKGFGKKLCEMLEDRLKKHEKGGNVEYNVETEIATTPKPKKSPKKKKKTTENKAISPNNENEYVPTYKSGGYAILIALYKATLTDNGDSLFKKDLIKAAQAFSNTSFTKAEPGSYYTAWSSMKTLICKNLVRKQGSPSKYSLTNEGILLGHKLYTKKNYDEPLPSSLSSRSEKANVDNTLGNIFLDKKYSEASLDYESQKMHFDDLFEEDPSGKLDFCIPKPSVEASSELVGICGTFSSAKILNQEPIQKKETTKNIVEHEDCLFSPYSFDVILYVDTQETSGVHKCDDPIIAELKQLDVNFEVKNLKVGDYCWICRDRMSAVELVTPYIIERKRMDDLAASIKDGRFYEQKFRLKQCGLQNVIYMIESYGKNDEHVGLPLNSLYQATINTLVQDGFCVKFVEGVRGVAEYLSCMSNLIKRNYESKTLVSCPKENIIDISITDDLVSLMFFKEFNKLSSKAKIFTVKEMFIKQLLQIKGLSIDKAVAIVEVYPTPQSLNNAFKENGIKSMNIISNVKYGNLGKKIGPILGNVIYQLFTKSSF